MITHYKPLNSELEKEYEALESYLKQHKIEGIICKKINGGSGKWRYEDEKIDLIESRKYFHYKKISATEFADYFMDECVR